MSLSPADKNHDNARAITNLAVRWRDRTKVNFGCCDVPGKTPASERSGNNAVCCNNALTMQGSFQRFRVSRRTPRKARKLPAAPEEAVLPVQGEESRQSACQRCRRLKKKCTRTRQGACSLCVAAWLPCSFPQDSQEREKALRERVSWLSQYVNKARSPNAVPVELVETGKDLTAAQVSEGSVSDANRYEESLERSEVRSAEHASPETTPFLDKATCHHFVNAYFRHVHRAYPFIDRDQIVQETDRIYELADNVPVVKIPQIPTRLCIIMAIGRTTLQRANELENTDWIPIEIAEKEIVHECLCKSDLASVEILTLLALYSLFEASSIPPWTITGILARKAISMGLTRDNSMPENISQVEVERRRRLFWSVYVLDRMMSVSYGLAPSISDDEIKISLPSITVQEYASTDRYFYAMTLQVNRHVVSLRRLEGKILQTIHLASSHQPILYNQGIMASHIDEFRRQIDDWYTQGCLLSSSTLNDNDQIPFHNTITWHNARYQNLLILLYSPSKLNFQYSIERLPELQSAAQRYVQSSLVLQQQKHLPLNWITLCRFLTMGAIFFHCYVWRLNQTKPTSGIHIQGKKAESILPTSTGSPGQPFNREDLLEEISNGVAVCAKILDSFPKRWQTAKQAALVFWQLAEYISAQRSPSHLQFESPSTDGSAPIIDTMPRHFDPVLDSMGLYNNIQPALATSGVEISRNEEQLVPLRIIRNEIMQLIKTSLGNTSIYAYAVGEDESTLRLTAMESNLFPFNDSASATDELFQGSNMPLSAGMSGLWLDVMDDLSLGVL